MKNRWIIRIMPLILCVLLIVALVPMPQATSAEDLRSAVTLKQMADTLSAKIDSMPTGGTHRTGRVDLSGFTQSSDGANDAKELSGRYYLVRKEGNKFYALDGSWTGSNGSLPLKEVTVSDTTNFYYLVSGISLQMPFSFHYMGIASNGMPGYVIRFSNGTNLAVGTQYTDGNTNLYHVKQDTNTELTKCQKIRFVHPDGEAWFRISNLSGTHGFRQNTDLSGFHWKDNSKGDNLYDGNALYLYRVWQTKDLCDTIHRMQSYLKTPELYEESSFRAFVECLQEAYDLFYRYNPKPTALIDPYDNIQDKIDTQIRALTAAIPQIYYNKVVSASSVSVPAYSGGTSSGWMTYDCGAAATYGQTGSESKMQIVTSTTEAQFNAYCTKLDGGNYIKLYSNTVPAQSGNNLYAKYLSKDGTHSLYTYFTAYNKQTRIIVDTQSESFRTYHYGGTGTLRTEFYMYGLSAAEDGWDTNDTELNTQNRSNGGTFLIMRMADNSLFLIDGGGSDQMSDRSCEDLYAFLRRITKTDDTEKLIINTWFVTHPHVDHTAGIARFLHKYSTHFELLNIMYNFDVVSGSTEYIQRVSRLFPNARFYKQHTGESFTVCDTRFDILYSVEDRYYPNSSNQLIKNDSSCMDNTNENNISSAMRVTMGSKTMILTGDMGNADTIMMSMYPASALKADLLQLPHHGFDDHTTLAKTVAPSVSFLNQSGTAVANRKNIHNFDAAWKPYAGTVYYGCSNIVGYTAKSGVFLVEDFQDLDFLNWTGRTYEMQEANPYNGETKVYAPELYYRYTKATSLPTTEKAYLIVDNKLNKVLSYDAVSGTIRNADTGLYDGTNWYFAAQDRHLVNWLTYGTRVATPHDKSPMQNNAVTTYYSGVPVWKGTGGYWSTGTKPAAFTLGYQDTFSSNGMFNCRSPFSEQLEKDPNWTWMDLLPDKSFLIYRHENGTYFPLYRDGNIKEHDGWSVTKMNSSQVQSNVDYLKTNLYLYNETSSKMYVTWTGHKDYTCSKGIPINNLISLLSADIRVTWGFDSFSGSGEAFHTARDEKNPGEYWFEFSPAYSSSTAGDYTTTIKYKNANGTVMDVGTFTLHVKNRESYDLGAKQLLFDFGNTTVDQKRYRDESQYKQINFDGTSRWIFTQNISGKGTTALPGSINTEDGTMVIRKTAATNEGNSIFAYTYAKGTTPLNFNPKYAQVLQIRLKMDNMQAVSNTNPFFRLWYNKSDGTSTYDRNYLFGSNYVSDGEYMVITFDLYTADDIAANSSVSGFPTQTMNSLSSVTGIRLGFHGFTLTDASQEGAITIDYVYIGPKDGVPNQTELRFDFGNTTAEKKRYNTKTYGYTQFANATETNWFYKTDRVTNVTIDNAASTLTIHAKPELGAGGWPDVYIDTNIGPKGTQYPLNFHPNEAEYFQIRFKMKNFRIGDQQITNSDGTTSLKTVNPYMNLRYFVEGGGSTASATNYSYAMADDINSDTYIVISMPLTDEFKNEETISKLRLYFGGIESISATKVGELTIDYVYVGTFANLPTPVYTVTFKDAAGKTLATQQVHKGETATYTGKTPTKASDSTNHYTFKGWNKALTNITANTTFTAQFTATAHTWTYAKADATNHKVSCTCGYSKNEAHSYTYKATKNPTTSATGTLTGTCSKCTGTTTVTLPKLNTTDYTKTVTKAATCTETGTDTYKWKTTTYGTFSFTATTAATGHSYTYKATKNPTTSATGTLTGTCSKCSQTTSVTLPKLNTTDYTKTVTKAPTCTETGTDTYKWNTTTYGSFSFTATTAATGHNYTYKATKNPTTSATGTLTGTCSNCSGTTTVTLPKLNTTDYTKTVTKAATCTETGTDTYKWNTTTYGSFSFTATTAATGHSYTYKATKNPTTSATGTLTGTCSKCSGTTTVILPKLNTTDYTKTVTKAATCTETGTDTYKWNTTTYGSFSFTATTNALGHSYTAKVKAPTCTAQGYTTHTCSRCSDSYKDTYTNATGHNYTSKVTTAATCTTAGVKTFTCSKCNHSYTEAIAATGHTEVVDKAVAATCTTAGKTEGSHCSVCNAVIKAQTNIPATGHSYTSKVTTVATCTTAGVKTFTCSKCSHSYTEAIAATGHTEVVDKAVAATCTTAGKTEGSHCSVCNAVIKAQTTIPATGHSYTSKVTTAATCTNNGVKTFTCSKCSHSYTEAIAATGHTEVVDKAVAATCTTAGKTEGSHCSVCNAVIKAQTTVPATGHSYTSKVTTAATCTTAGVKTFTCSKCDHSYTEAIAATGHTEVVDKAVAATCTTAGKTEGSHCSVCNAVIKAQTTVPATGHSYTSKVTTAATCTTAGVKTFSCSKCSHSYTEAIAATGHTEVVDKAVAATCTTAGKTEGSHCSVCNTVIKAQTNIPATGHSYTSKVTTAATCTTAGVKTFTCSKCNHSYTEAIAATGHTEMVDKAVAATCTTAGKTEGSHCSVCNAVIKAQTTIPATGHSYTSKVTTAAACTKDGVKTFTCSKCSHSYTEAIAATGHTEVVDKAVAATCTTAGKTEGSHCSVCNAVIKAQTTVPATGHSYTSKVTTAATCTKDGVKTFTCSKCNHSYTEAISATGHTEVVDKAVAATCTTAGKTEGSHCSVCNAVIKAQTTVPATGHSYTSKVTTAATCTKDGVKTFTCSKCNHSYTETIAATGHTEVVDKAVAATCTTAGKTECSHCSVCNAVIKAQTTVPATGHSYTSRVTTAATCTKDGVKTFTCSKCNHSYTEAIAATGHTEVIDKAVAATCTTAGKTEGSHCSVCNAVIKAQTTVPATGHSYTSKVTTAATCTKEGVKTFTCSKCSDSYTEAIAATGHTEVVDKAVAATCTTAGKTEGSHCSVCNAVIKAQTTVPATGHSYTSKVTTAATCTTAGVKTFTCSKCSHSYTEAIAATGHTEVVDKAVAATCTTAGKTEGSHCSVCNSVIKAQTNIPAMGHSYGYTSNGDGTHVVSCARCNDSYAEKHDFANGDCICGDKERTLDENINILHTLNLASDIAITFAVPKTALASYDSYYLECEIPKYEGNTLVGSTNVQIQPVLTGSYYYFTLTGITAVQMNDTVDAVLHMTKGTQEYYSKTDRYSVASYAYKTLNESKDAKMLTLCADLLRYGAEAQSYKKYRTDALVDADMTATHRSYLSNTNSLTFSQTDSNLADLSNPTITWVGKTLDLGSKVGIKFVFDTTNYSGDISKLSMKVTYVNSQGETTTVTLTGAEVYSADKGYYSFTFYGLLASELRTAIEVAVYEGETRLSETLRYSAETYASKTVGNALEPLTRALFAYSDSAKAYFTK